MALFDRLDDAVAAACAARVTMAQLATTAPGFSGFRTAVEIGHRVFAACYGEHAAQIDLNRFWVIALGLIDGEIVRAATVDADRACWWRARSRIRPREYV